MSVASWCSTCFCVVLCDGFCLGHFVMAPLNLTYLVHCLNSLPLNISSIYITIYNISFLRWRGNAYLLNNSVSCLFDNWSKLDVFIF